MTRDDAQQRDPNITCIGLGLGHSSQPRWPAEEGGKQKQIQQHGKTNRFVHFLLFSIESFEHLPEPSVFWPVCATKAPKLSLLDGEPCGADPLLPQSNNSKAKK